MLSAPQAIGAADLALIVEGPRGASGVARTITLGMAPPANPRPQPVKMLGLPDEYAQSTA
jgi:hypothetical protein